MAAHILKTVLWRVQARLSIMGMLSYVLLASCANHTCTSKRSRITLKTLPYVIVCLVTVSVEDVANFHFTAISQQQISTILFQWLILNLGLGLQIQAQGSLIRETQSEIFIL
jgi:hypothetical protein